MTDTVIKGTGNSRSLRTVPNALTLYDTHEKMLAAMIDGSFPIDLGHLNAAGLEQRGTDLVKATLLSDTTETALWGGAEDRTVDEALAKLRAQNLIAQSTADAAQKELSEKVGAQSGSYTANGANQRLDFSAPWHIVGVYGSFNGYTAGLFFSSGLGIVVRENQMQVVTCASTTTSLTIRSSGYGSWLTQGGTFTWWAI